MCTGYVLLIVRGESTSLVEVTDEHDLAVFRLDVGGDEPSLAAVDCVRNGAAPALAESIEAGPIVARPVEPVPDDLDHLDEGCPHLSERERQVLAYIASGLTHSQIATRMRISKATVDTYVGRIRRKLGAGNKADLTRAALTLDLVTRPSA